ncbi:hypothetical protein [Erythrobacter sp.]|uniref:hypothetical protein n=1 Tax=Erythrobacter sp. TaxID=1042 RepID=UPI00311F3A48
MAFWLLCFASICIGYGVGWFSPRLSFFGPVGRIAVFGLLPVWLYSAFMATAASTGSFREDAGWFGVGLMMISPFVALWFGGFSSAVIMRRRRARLRIDSTIASR